PTRATTSRLTSLSTCCRRWTNPPAAVCLMTKRRATPRFAAARWKPWRSFEARMSELAEQIADYLDELRRSASSEHTVRAYESDLRQFLEYFSPEGGEPPALAEFDVLKLREWLGGLYDRQLDRISMRRKLAALRSFFRHVVRKGILPTNPARLVLT